MWLLNVLYAGDVLLNAFAGGDKRSTISARVGYFAMTKPNNVYWQVLQAIIDWCFSPVEDNHCANAIVAQGHYRRGNDVALTILALIVAIGAIPLSLIVWLVSFWVKKPLNGQPAPPHMVVAAACKYGDTIFVGARHYDPFIHGQLRQISQESEIKLMNKGQVEQGFIDNTGLFLNRTHAWKVAREAGQIIRRVGGDEADGGTLYSENLW